MKYKVAEDDSTTVDVDADEFFVDVHGITFYRTINADVPQEWPVRQIAVAFFPKVLRVTLND